MAVLGKGTAHGACSLLHAAPLGYGSAMALDLPITVRLLDRPSKREVDDSDGVLNHLLDAWLAAGLPLPQGFERDDLRHDVHDAFSPSPLQGQGQGFDDQDKYQRLANHDS